MRGNVAVSRLERSFSLPQLVGQGSIFLAPGLCFTAAIARSSFSESASQAWAGLEPRTRAARQTRSARGLVKGGELQQEEDNGPKTRDIWRKDAWLSLHLSLTDRRRSWPNQRPSQMASPAACKTLSSAPPRALLEANHHPEPACLEAQKWIEVSGGANTTGACCLDTVWAGRHGPRFHAPSPGGGGDINKQPFTAGESSPVGEGAG